MCGRPTTKAGLILDDANIKAEKIVETARKNITDEEAELLRIRKEVSNFKSRMLSIYREHLALIDVLPDLREEQEEKAEPEQPADEEGPARRGGGRTGAVRSRDGDAAYPTGPGRSGTGPGI